MIIFYAYITLYMIYATHISHMLLCNIIMYLLCMIKVVMFCLPPLMEKRLP